MMSSARLAAFARLMSQRTHVELRHRLHVDEEPAARDKHHHVCLSWQVDALEGVFAVHRQTVGQPNLDHIGTPRLGLRPQNARLPPTEVSLVWLELIASHVVVDLGREPAVTVVGNEVGAEGSLGQHRADRVGQMPHVGEYRKEGGLAFLRV